MKDFWDMVKFWFKKKGSYPSKPSEVKGSGPVNAWSLIDPYKLGDALLDAKCNTTIIEFLGWASALYYDNPAPLKEKYKLFLRVMRRRGILVYVIVINWNKGKVLGGSSGPSICDTRYSSTWFDDVLKIITEEGTEGVCLEAVSEWADAHKECTAKAQQFVNLASGKWSGLKGWNKGSRPTSAPPGFWLNWHIMSAVPAGPSGCINTTDTSPVLDWLGGLWAHANPAKVEELGKAVRGSGRGFLLYQFGVKDIDYEAIKALGRVP